MNTDSTVLVIVDVQGKLATLMDGADLLFKNLERCVLGAQALQIPILIVEQLPDKLGETIPDILQHVPDLPRISKSTFSAVGNNLFRHELALLERKDILLVGIEAHICVYQTAKDLIEEDFNVYIVSDAVGSRLPANKALALGNMKELGVNLTSVEMCLFELMQSAEHKAFKAIQRIVK